MKKYVIFVLLGFVFLFVVFINSNADKSILEPLAQKEHEKQSFTFITTGDIGLGRYVNYVILNNTADYPFSNISEHFNSADFVIANLENPLIKNCPVVVTGFKFCGSSENVSALVNANVKAVSLANNHATNYGLAGLQETMEVLDANGITGFGLNKKIEYLDIKGSRVALVGFVELGNNWGGLNNATEENIKNLITEANKNSDIVISAFHWGTEYTHIPTENQRRLGHLAVDFGADIVLGNHPHWVQPIETYKDKYVIYAQGNTIFDQDWSLKTREGVLYKFEFQNGKINMVDEKFTIIENNSQPRFADQNESSRIKSYISF